ncbi:decapping and exoribonuclease protein [Narcine bancroftii]|uniref:decapping and exoribonuclease protein n=1 Tax=Narcine bancroftii TaxID=1343680 RepID=UPI003831D028
MFSNQFTACCGRSVQTDVGDGPVSGIAPLWLWAQSRCRRLVTYAIAKVRRIERGPGISVREGGRRALPETAICAQAGVKPEATGSPFTRSFRLGNWRRCPVPGGVGKSEGHHWHQGTLSERMEKHFDRSGQPLRRCFRQREDDVQECPRKFQLLGTGLAHQTTGDKCACVLSVFPDLYDLKFPDYRQPVEIGCFSLDSHRCLFNDNRQLRYCNIPSNKKLNFDLRDGFKDRYIKRNDDVKEKLDNILRWILLNKHKFLMPTGDERSPVMTNQLHTHFITWRGHLTKILTTPYENRDGWMMAVTLFNGTYYMSEVETEKARCQREQRTEQQEELMYGGYKFEQYLCADKPDGSPDPAGVVNTNEAFCCVVRTQLNTHSLVFSGEVDCKDSSDPKLKAPQCYLELKTSREIYSPNQQRNFLRFKLVKWWAQSFLPGVPRIIAGFRNDNGRVVSLQTF